MSQRSLSRIAVHPLLALRLAMALSICLLPSCIRIVKDISGNPEFGAYQGDYQPNAVYVLQREVRLFDWDPGITETHRFNPNVPRYFLCPAAPDMPEDQPEPRAKYLGMMPAGTRLRFEQLTYHNYVESTSIYPFARITDGAHSGKRVDLSEISREELRWEPEFSYRHFRDPRYLEVERGDTK